MENNILSGANVSAIRVVGTDTYSFYSRVDGYFAVIKNNELETDYTYYIGYDKVVKSVGTPGATPNYDAVETAPDSVAYAIPAMMPEQQKKLLMSSLIGHDHISDRDFK